MFPVKYAIIAFIFGLTVVGATAAPGLNATSYSGYITVQNVVAWDVTIYAAHATVTDPQGIIVATFDVANLPVVIHRGETATIVVPVQLSNTMNKLDQSYADNVPFVVHGIASYSTWWGTRDVDISITLTKGEIYALKSMAG